MIRVSFVTVQRLPFAESLAISVATHPALVARLRTLARRGVTPAEARRNVVLFALARGLAPPSYSTVLRIVTRARVRHEQLRREPGVMDSLVLGRVPTPREVEGTLARALEHKRSPG